jgi:hypothetical protein
VLTATPSAPDADPKHRPVLVLTATPARLLGAHRHAFGAGSLTPNIDRFWCSLPRHCMAPESLTPAVCLPRRNANPSMPAAPERLPCTRILHRYSGAHCHAGPGVGAHCHAAAPDADPNVAGSGAHCHAGPVAWCSPSRLRRRFATPNIDRFWCSCHAFGAGVLIPAICLPRRMLTPGVPATPEC